MFRFNKQYINKKNTEIYKGILVICVFLAHLGNYEINYFDNYSFQFLTPLGYLAVSVFLFLSGYGLSYSVNEKGKFYFNSFIKRRVLPLYIEYILFVVLYTIYQVIFFKMDISFEKLFTTLTIGETYVNNGWYVQCIIIIYLFFYVIISSKIGETHGIVPLAIVGVYTGLYIILQLDFIYVQSIAAFIVGYFYFLLQDTINQKLENDRMFLIMAIFWLFLFLTIFGASYVIGNIIIRRILRILVCAVAPIIFVIGVSHIKFDSKIAKIIGELSLEMYLLQGMFFSFWGSICRIEFSLMYAILVFGTTFLSAKIVHYGFKKMRNINFGIKR